MLLQEIEGEISFPHNTALSLDFFERQLAAKLGNGVIPFRFVVSEIAEGRCKFEAGGFANSCLNHEDNLFDFRVRQFESQGSFNAVLLIPTGIGAELGGHAGDAGPVARLFAGICDTLVIHPNVVNASDINEQPENALYVEGSLLTRMLMGSVGLRRVRSNRVLVVIDDHEDDYFVNSAVNSVNAARAAYGLNSAEVVCLNPPVSMRARFSTSGRAAGRVESLEVLWNLLESRKGDFDAVALSSVIDVPSDFHQGYFDAYGEMVNPWGGVEALLSHAVSTYFNVPSAHSPMFENATIANHNPGIVDARMAAEAVSVTFLQCILKGLMKSPRVIRDSKHFVSPDVFSAEDVSCLVIPDGCVGLPTFAAIEQRMPVIAVRSNNNILCNDLSMLPWAENQLFYVDSYFEAAGLMCAIKAGLDPRSCERPLANTRVSQFGSKSSFEDAQQERDAARSHTR